MTIGYNDRIIDSLANEGQQKIRQRKNWVSFNKKQGFSFDPKDGIRAIICGEPGSGKSYALAVILNQFKNVLMFDPSPNIDFFGKTLDEIGVQEEWICYRLDPKSKAKNVLKLNICDCGEEVANAIFYKTIKNANERNKRNAMQKFFRLPRDRKNWSDFKHMMIENDLDGYLEDFGWVFSKQDDGKSIEDLQVGKIVIGIEGINSQSMALGIFLAVLSESRTGLKKRGEIDELGEDFLVLSLDEGQSYAMLNTSLGNSMAKNNAVLRKCGIGQVVAGSFWSGKEIGFHPVLRKNRNYTFIFNSPASEKGYMGDAIDVRSYDFDGLEKYHFFFWNDEEKLPRRTVFCDTFFLDVRRALASAGEDRRIDPFEVDSESVFQDLLRLM